MDFYYLNLQNHLAVMQHQKLQAEKSNLALNQDASGLTSK